MIEGLQDLLALQRLDDELIAFQHEHQSLPEQRESLEKQSEAAEALLAEANEAAGAAEAGQRAAETGLQDQEALLHKLEGQQSQVKTNDAYTALLHEMDQAREAISECETSILESMDQIEKARSARETAERENRETRSRVEGEQSALDARAAVLDQEIGRLTADRETLCTRLEPGVLSRYSKVASRRRPAVILVSKEMCNGCRMDIPPQTFIELLRGEKLISCENCQRVLVHQDQVGPPSA